MNNFKEKIGIGALVIGISAGTLLNNPVQCLLNNDEYIVVPVEEVVASDFERSKQTPETVVYSDDAEHFIISYDTEDIPGHFADKEKHSCTEIAEEIKDIPMDKEDDNLK